MFGMSLPEIITIAVIAVIVLGPDKLPQTMVNIAKTFKSIKKSLNDAKTSFDQEIRIAELKEDAKKYKESITNATQSARKKLTFEELDEIKRELKSAKTNLSEGVADIKNSVEAVKNPTKAIKDAVMDNINNDKKEA